MTDLAVDERYHSSRIPQYLLFEPTVRSLKDSIVLVVCHQMMMASGATALVDHKQTLRVAGPHPASIRLGKHLVNQHMVGDNTPNCSCSSAAAAVASKLWQLSIVSPYVLGNLSIHRRRTTVYHD